MSGSSKLSTAETRDEFGRDAARRTTRLRERYDTKDIYLPRRNVVCAGDPSGRA